MLARMSSDAYPLGTTDAELERLRFQHAVWGPSTRACLGRAGLRPGLRVLDLGAGPGLVTLDILDAVGPEGAVVALDESPRWSDVLERARAARGAQNLRIVTARIQDAAFEPDAFDLVFARWVFSFLPDPAAVARAAARWLRPGGQLVIQDYNHEGISLFPPSQGFHAVVRATRALYAGMGGDTFVMGRALELFAVAGLEVLEVRPQAICGGPGSAAWRWADLFFPHFAGVMHEKGLLSTQELERFRREWTERSADPAALFFSPLVVDARARRPSSGAQARASSATCASAQSARAPRS